jgi:hypothetical protein
MVRTGAVAMVRSAEAMPGDADRAPLGTSPTDDDDDVKAA